MAACTSVCARAHEALSYSRRGLVVGPAVATLILILTPRKARLKARRTPLGERGRSLVSVSYISREFSPERRAKGNSKDLTI